MLTDCHTHLDMYPPDELAGMLHRAQAAGVGLMIVATTTLESCQGVLDLVHAHPFLYAGVGLHPITLEHPVTETTLQRLHEIAGGDDKVVAVSEVGLDFRHGPLARPAQEEALRAQVRLARQLDLPIIYHTGGFHDDVLRLLQKEHAGDVGGAWHSFEGDLSQAQQALEMGFYLSLAKSLLDRPDLQETVRHIPLRHIVLETDTSPQRGSPVKKHFTEPSRVREVAQGLAHVKGVSLEEVEATTSANLGRLLKGRVPVLMR